MSDVFDLTQGAAALILSMPHVGQALPDDLGERLSPAGLGIEDTDWWIDRLYMPIAEALGASTIRANYSRYVIDLNRDPSGRSLYPGQATTGLVPVETFAGEPLYKAGCEPDEAEVAARRVTYFAPYHEALAAEIDRVIQLHGFVVLYDCHSIRSHIPRLFDGELPVFNIGTNGGISCAAGVGDAVFHVCATSGESHVRDGRFRGGWITRHYGRPAEATHAVQMELALRSYMDEFHPWRFDEDKAQRLRVHLKALLAAALVAAKKSGNLASAGRHI